MLRVGIIGAAWGAFAHLPAWRAVAGVDVVAICTSRRETAEAAASRLGIARAFHDAEAMCRDADIDIVDCGSRPNLRERWVLAALEAGKHVYDAVPFAASFDGARRLAAAQKTSGAVGVVDAFSQWLPQFRLLKERLDDGALGAPFGGSCRFALSLFNRPDPRFPYAWFAEAGTGVSALRNLGSHALHLLLHLFGPIDAVVADDRIALATWTYPDGATRAARNPDLAHAILRFRSGLVMTLQTSWSAAAGEG
ncbi:MAG: Gfo/Idh/MocA family oxidoreductase, partial [Parvularculaceae bacterium]|nr:Gfo/Idh/MocA family oxidoreductase [Parvularculaceae bacterium]